MRKKLLTLISLAGIFQIFLFQNVSLVSAALRCGTDLYNGKLTGCYAVNIGGRTVPSTGDPEDWACGPLRQCFYSDEYKGVCGQDNFTDENGKRKLTFCSVSGIGREHALGYTGCNTGEFCLVGPELGDQTCNWGVTDQDRIKFCFYGFGTAEELQASKIEFECTSNCGGPVDSLLRGGSKQVFPLSGAPVGDAEQGKYSCVEMDLDQSAINAVQYQVDVATAGCHVAEVGGLIISTVATGGLTALGQTGAAVTLIGTGGITTVAKLVAGEAVKTVVRLGFPLAITGGSGNICVDAARRYTPAISGTVIKGDGSLACRQFLQFDFNAYVEAQANKQFVLCQQAGPEGSPGREKCQTCYEKKGIWTAVGCIPFSDTAELVRAFITLGLGIAGTVVVLMTLAGAFLMSTSKGEPQKVDEAKSLITSAIAGIFFLIFSVSILQFIGVRILQLPGFG